MELAGDAPHGYHQNGVIAARHHKHEVKAPAARRLHTHKLVKMLESP